MKISASTSHEFIACIILLFIAAVSCRPSRQSISQKNDDTSPDQTGISLNINNLADSMICIPNKDSSYYLCQDKQTAKHHKINPLEVNSIMIINSESWAVIFSEKIMGGSARWLDSVNAEIFTPSGIPRNPLQTTYRFNVITKKRSDSVSKNE